MSSKINGVTGDQAALFEALVRSAGGTGGARSVEDSFDGYDNLFVSMNGNRSSSPDDYDFLNKSVRGSRPSSDINDFDDLTSSVVHGRKPSAASSPSDLSQSIERFIAGNCPYFTRIGGDGSIFYVTHNITIGRLPHNDIQLVDTSVSRLHCRVFIRGGEYYCVDMTPDTSSNKAVLDGRQVNNGHPNNDDDLIKFPLRDGSKLCIGNSVLEFHLPSPADMNYAAGLADCVSGIKL